MPRFEIHSHSMFSNNRLIDCINKIIDLITTAYDKGLSGITLTDHESLSGSIEWLQIEDELKKTGRISQDFKCAIGNEIYLVDSRENCTWFPHFILIAKSEEGHRALRELSSTAWYNSFRYKGMERVPTTKEELRNIVNKYPNSLIASSACLGSEVARKTIELIKLEKSENEEEIYQKKLEIVDFCSFCRELFGDDFYLEVAPSASIDQKKYNKRIKEIAKGLKIPLVFGGDAHYLTKNDRFIHKAFLNSKNGEREVDDFYSYAYLMDDDEAFENCDGIFTREEFEEICLNSIQIMNKIGHYSLAHTPIIPTTKVREYERKTCEDLDKYPTLSALLSGDSVQDRYWANQCIDGLKKIERYNDEYLSRLEVEADVIKTVGNKLGNDLFAYFNTFQSYIDLFWDCGSIVGPGRGSSVCYLSNYLLGITQLNPIEYNLPSFRFLNKERLELPDIDCDLSPSKRPLIFSKIREKVGETNLLQVATFTTVGSKSAVLIACRGYRSQEYPDGIDTDAAHYIASMIPSERGFLWSIDDMIHGNEEKGRSPNKQFISEIKKYDGLLDIIKGIEGLVTTRSQHASGVIIYNTSCCDTNALMRSPSGDLTTQYDLHDSEFAGDVKFDFLLTEVCDKLINTITLLQKDNFLPKEYGLKQIYNNYLHPSKLDLSDTKIWDALAAGKVMDVFQFSTQVGLQAAMSIKPRDPNEMMMANALTRLVGEKGKERPIDRYVRMKNNIQDWYDECHSKGLSENQIKILKPYYLPSSGCPTTQEKLMLLCMDKNIANFSLGNANKARKICAKKKMNEVAGLHEQFLESCEDKNFAEYIWQTAIEPQMSYSFAEPHALAYSFVGIQTLYLATSFPIIYWNCACLISNSGSSLDEDDYKDIDNDDNDEIAENIEEDSRKTAKKKKKTANYDKIATAIGKMKSSGIEVAPPSINKSTYTFSPDLESMSIRYGLSGIVKIGSEIVKSIIDNRPYSSIDSFLAKVKVNKPQMINLIKAGAFDEFGDRIEIMHQYVDEISDTKKRITLQNMKMLIDFGLIPDEYDMTRRVYNFNKYLKKMKINEYYGLDNTALSFFDKHFSLDVLTPTELSESGFMILQTKWDKIYQSYMDKIRPFIKNNNSKLLSAVNEKITKDMWDKYCLGSLSKWEMDSVSFYSHEHELSRVNMYQYGINDFNELPDNPEIDKVITIKGKQVPIYKIRRIFGTVIGVDKIKKSVVLLTLNGVVNVKIFGDIFSVYNKQISERGADGVKHVREASWFKRGNKIIVAGVKQGENDFIGKKYKSTPYHLIELITKINEDGTIETRGERMEVSE